MAKQTFKLTTRANSTTTRTIESVNIVEVKMKEQAIPAPSEETVARLNAIAREYPFCAYIKQSKTYML
jgi:hypothetical protein